MSQGRQTIYVFFCRSPRNVIGKRTWSHRWNQFWAFIVRWFTWTPGEHVCIGHDGIVVDPLYGGDHLWELSGFVRRYPIVETVIVTPCDFRIDLRYFDRPKVPKNRLFPVLFWFTGLMRFRTDDCLGVAIECLRAAGVDVPVTLRTTGGLYRWLKREGYVCEPAAARRVDHAVVQ